MSELIVRLRSCEILNHNMAEGRPMKQSIPVQDSDWDVYISKTLIDARAYVVDAQTLAGLVTAYLTETGLRPTTPPLAIQQMRELAGKLKGGE